jgi:hypothetical protein
VVYVDTVAAFEAFLSIGLTGCCELGLDAEYSTTHLAARVSLLQLATHRQVFLLDMEVGGASILSNLGTGTQYIANLSLNMCGVGGLGIIIRTGRIIPPPVKGKNYFRSNKIVNVEKVTESGFLRYLFTLRAIISQLCWEKKLFTLRC